MAHRVHPSDDWPNHAEPTSDKAEKEQPKDVVRSEKGLVSSKAAVATTTTTASSFNPKPKPTRAPTSSTSPKTRFTASHRRRTTDSSEATFAAGPAMAAAGAAAAPPSSSFSSSSYPPSSSPPSSTSSPAPAPHTLLRHLRLLPRLQPHRRSPRSSPWADNPNKAVGIYCRAGSSVMAAYDEVEFVRGALPALYQGTKNVTELTVNLTASRILLSGDVRGSLTSAQRIGNVPLDWM